MAWHRRRSAFELLLLTVTSFVCVRLLFTVSPTQFYRVSNSEVDEYKRLKLGHFAYQPFRDDCAKKVVILTYQRCGSSFFGQLFNTNPDVFYIYEPLDSVYTAMYGTKDGWNVPSDITSHWDGTERRLPEREVKAVAVFLKHLLSCNVESLPTETLIHRYWLQFAGDHISLKNYIRCLRINKIQQKNCSTYTPLYCGNRFGEFSQERMDECNQRLWNASYSSERLDGSVHKNFTEYRACMDRLRTITLERCVHLFREVCQRSRLRSAKTVRGTMASMEYLLESVPNFRVIHLIRDPRAVVLSRRQFDNSARGRYSMGNLVKEAKLYCRTVVNDVKARRRLEARHPGKIVTIIYDDLVKEPLRYTEMIYSFLNTTLPRATLKWVADHTTAVKDSSAIARKWRDQLTFREAYEIREQCLEFFQEVAYPWIGHS